MVQRELRETKEELRAAEDRLTAFQEEKIVHQLNAARSEGTDSSPISTSVIDQLVNAIISDSQSGAIISNEADRQKLHNLIESKLLQAIKPLNKKLRKSESTVADYKGRYRDKVY